MNRLTAVGSLLAAALLLGCGAPTGSTAAAADAALAFHAALTRHDGERACRLLAPRTFHELEESAKSACPEAVVDERLPPGGGLRRTELFGDTARVVLGADTVFVGRFDQDWKILAAGCAPRAGLPYECAIQGS